MCAEGDHHIELGDDRSQATMERIEEQRQRSRPGRIGNNDENPLTDEIVRRERSSNHVRTAASDSGGKSSAILRVDLNLSGGGKRLRL